VSADDATLIVTGEGKDAPAPPLVQSQQSLLYAEARRLLDFKRQHITRQNQTPCPECAVPVSVQARKCPHCGSEIAEYTDAARQALGELNALTREIAELHSRELSRYAEGIRARSLRERAALFFADPQVQRDLRILLPAALLLFVVLVLVRVSASGLVFWLVAPLAGSLAWVTLRRSGVNHYVAVDLYRARCSPRGSECCCAARCSPRGASGRRRSRRPSRSRSRAPTCASKQRPTRRWSAARRGASGCTSWIAAAAGSACARTRARRAGSTRIWSSSVRLAAVLPKGGPGS
jgi:hypothetical protein